MLEIRKLVFKYSQTFKTIGKILLLLTLLSIILPLIQTPKDKFNIDTDFDVEKRYDNLVRKYLAPWLPVDSDSPSTRVVVTQRMLAIVEYTHKGACVRVRWYNGKLFFRVIMNLRLKYFYERMEFLLRSLNEIGQDGLYTGNWDAIFNLADGPLISKDTFRKLGGFPIFSRRTSDLHRDIPYIDPVAYGSNGNYVWPEDLKSKILPWNERHPTAVFRGTTSCLILQADNWHACNRVRATKLSLDEQKILASNQKPLLDIGITDWKKIPKQLDLLRIKGLNESATQAEIEISTGIKLTKKLDFYEQGNFKYILEMDGGLGSSRTQGILGSDSLLIAERSPWRCWFFPLLKENYHFLAFNNDLRDLKARIKWARENDDQVRLMIERANKFHEKVLSYSHAKIYFSKLLNMYSKELLSNEVKQDISGNNTNFDYCNLYGTGNLSVDDDVSKGPLGCSQGWFEWKTEIPNPTIAEFKILSRSQYFDLNKQSDYTYPY